MIAYNQEAPGLSVGNAAIEAAMRTMAAAVVLAGVSSPALAQSFPCSGATVSPYPALVATDHDHDHGRVAPEPAELTKAFTAFMASFDNADDDDADGEDDIRLNPEFVVYELRGVGPHEDGDYAEPAMFCLFGSVHGNSGS